MWFWSLLSALVIAGGAAALFAHHPAASACAMASLAGAIAVAIRSLAGPSLAATTSAMVGAMLGVIGLYTLPYHGVRFAVGGAAALLAVGELARATPGTRSLAAAAAALFASVCDPAYVPLTAVAGVHVAVSRRHAGRRWGVMLVVVGVFATAAAIWMATEARDTSLWRVWFGLPDAAGVPEPGGPIHALNRSVAHRFGAGVLGQTVDALGPMVAVTSLAGLALCTVRGRLAGLAVASVAAMTVLIAQTMAVSASVPIMAALCSGVGLARFAGIVGNSVGQAFVGATFGGLLVVAAAYRLLVTM